MKEKNTTIMISSTTWKKLMSLKEVGETFDDIITRLVEEQK